MLFNEEVELSELLLSIVGGGTPSKANQEFYKGTIPWVTVKDLKSQRIYDAQDHISEDAVRQSSTNLIPKGNVVVATRMALGKAFINEVDIAINQDLKALIANSSKVDTTYLLYSLLKNSEKIQHMGTGTTVKGIRLDQLKKLKFFVPSLNEQQKIAEILSSVDEAIEKTEAIIKQTETVKKGLMQQLLTKGIGHTEFKQTEIGQVPSEWNMTALGQLFKVIQRPLKMKNDEEYQLVTVKRRQEGIVPREKLLGKHIKVKSQFFVEAGDFLISKRQIVHGACEVVPQQLSGAIVSNEYNVLAPQEMLDIDFMRWLSRTPLLMKYFLLSSIGVHIEKMLFKIDDWFKREIALPPLEEQQKIASILNSVEKSIEVNKRYLEEKKRLKQALMQTLLTGKTRVNVDQPEVLI